MYKRSNKYAYQTKTLGGLSFRDLWEMTQSTFEVNDFFGWCVL